jgi:triosephosphate isomerase (TIM)
MRREMARKVIIGNWKMNKSREEALALCAALAKSPIMAEADVQVGIAPAFPFLALIHDTCKGRHFLAAQNCSEHKKGAYTGEVSAEMLASAGCSHVILGHSERRLYHEETDTVVAAKVRSALDAGLSPVLCCGETLNERRTTIHFDVIDRQITLGLKEVAPEEWHRIIIAYEPVWAIGTGETATPGQAAEMHAFIRRRLCEMIGDKAESVPLLYGGSCNPANASELFAVADVNGGLIGGASLIADDFIRLVELLNESK